jgi:hypothetical protein
LSTKNALIAKKNFELGRINRKKAGLKRISYAKKNSLFIAALFAFSGASYFSTPSFTLKLGFPQRTPGIKNKSSMPSSYGGEESCFWTVLSGHRRKN